MLSRSSRSRSGKMVHQERQEDQYSCRGRLDAGWSGTTTLRIANCAMLTTLDHELRRRDTGLHPGILGWRRLDQRPDQSGPN